MVNHSYHASIRASDKENIIQIMLVYIAIAPLSAWVITILYSMIVQPDKPTVITEYMWILGGLLVIYAIKNVLNVIKNIKS